MKITHVIPFYAPAWGYGGPVRVSYELAKESANRGHQVQVFTTDAYDHTRRIDQVCEVHDKVKIFRSRNLSNKLAKCYNLFLPLGFSKLCKNNIKNADIVHLHSFYHFLNVIAVKCARRYKVPYLIHLHELPLAQPIFGKVPIKKAFLRLWGIKMLQGATKIICLTQNEKDLTLKAYPFLKNKIEILPNSIDKVSRAKPNSDLRKKYKYQQSDKIVLSLSRLSNLKRVDRAIRAFAEASKLDPNFKLIVAGPDEMGNLTKLQAQVKNLELSDKVWFPGAVQGQKKNDVFNLANIYILLPDYESFSITTLEALSYGALPVINRKVGIAKDIEPYNVACIISDSDKKVGKQLIKAYNNRASYKKNIARALACFTAETVSKQLEDIYSKTQDAFKR